jgi:V/A-type H+/Na+-transporting ATPase subunit E
MSNNDQITGLESTLLARAQKLAEEYKTSGQHVRQQILAEANQRLRIEEEREVLAAKARAERAYQQRVQAAELELHSELDHLRWELVNTILDYLPARLTELAADDTRYLPLLLSWLREAALAIERDHLVVQVNQRDLPRLKNDWAKFAGEAAPGKKLELSEQPLDSIGGVLVSSADGDIRFDNTFEGRMEKMDEALQGAIVEQLLLAAGEAHAR